MTKIKLIPQYKREDLMHEYVALIIFSNNVFTKYIKDHHEKSTQHVENMEVFVPWYDDKIFAC